MKMRLIGLLAFVFTVTCQYPVDLSNLPETQKFLVIDAALTDQFIRLNVQYSLENISSSGAYTIPKPPLTKAYVLDSKGIKYDIKNTVGVADSLFKGIIGEKYRMFLDVEGKAYVSDVETLNPTPAFDTLFAQYTREEFRSPEDLLYDGFDVYAQTVDISGVDNYYQWDWIHYEKAAYCTKFYSQEEGHEVVIQCNPSFCLNITYNPKVLIQSDKLSDGKTLVQRVARIPYAIPPTKYFLKVEQRAISSSVYSYLQSLQIQNDQNGTLFDLPAQTRFSPNIYNVTDKEEKIVGAFMVYSFRTKDILIDMFQNIPGAKRKSVGDPTPHIADLRRAFPCVEGINRTQFRPLGWID